MREPEYIKEDDDTYSVVCDCGFRSTRWPKKRLAQERFEQHRAEHEDGAEMPSTSELLEAEGA